MQQKSTQNQISILKLRPKPASLANLMDWQAKFNTCIRTYPGFISLEFLSSKEKADRVWTIVQIFSSPKELAKWNASSAYAQLIEEVRPLLSKTSGFSEMTMAAIPLQHGVTEVFVAEVLPDKEEAYHEWLSKIHLIESQFPGFQGIYIQSPTHGLKPHWIIFLQFDTIPHLDNWLCSAKRKDLLEESQPLVSSFNSHRLYSPYAGWFHSLGQNEVPPPAWKQSMVVLLVLFPIVMIERSFLSLLTEGYNPSIATFIANALSVALLAFPMMPIALKCLGWWLSPPPDASFRINLLGIATLIALYVGEIAIFWFVN